MNINDEAVEAVARALFAMSYDPIMWDWASTLRHRQTCQNKARLAVEVAAPIIAADAWDEGAIAEANKWMKRPENPYRERKMTPEEIEEWRHTCPYPEALGE